MTGRSGRAKASPSGAFLLDVNVLVALAWPTHVHHSAARRWFAGAHRQGWATAPVTEFGFVRVSSNAAAVGDPLTPAEAIALLGEIRGRPGHESWVDDVSPTETRWVDPARLVGYRQVTDAHLLGLARRHGGRLATLDHRLTDLAGRQDATVLTAIPHT